MNLVRIRQLVHHQEAFIADNRAYIFTTVRKIHTHEENHNSELAILP
jgi:hypothetical protein